VNRFAPQTIALSIFLSIFAIVACCICWKFGFRAGAANSNLQQLRQGDILIALRIYEAAENTNWAKVQSTIGMQVLALTRDYERRFGVPIVTNQFAQQFAEAQAAATRVEKQLVTVGTALTNFPLAPDFKIRVVEEK
jgi:hypothetical protein